MARIDHAAIRTKSYEEAQHFFEDVFEMHMWREIGEKPGRKCWYKEGIQLCEVEELDAASENGYDHISIAVDSEAEIMEKIKVSKWQESITQQSARNHMKKHNIFLKMYLRCICGEKSVKNREENAGTKKVSSFAK